MPVMNGLEFLNHCRKEDVFQHIPIIVTGTQGKEEDTMNGIKAGAKAYLIKPFETANLYKVIDKVFNGSVYTQKDPMEFSLK
jgi:DNA-binding response OmpR family regulator